MRLYKRNPRIKPPVGSVLNPDHPLSQGLQVCVLANEGTGSTIYDLCRSSGFLGTFDGGASFKNNSLYFDPGGSVDFVRLKIWDNQSNQVSIVAGVRFESAIGSIEQITAADSSNVNLRTFQFRRNDTGRLESIFFKDNSPVIISSAATLTTGLDWDVAAACDNISNRLYMNGIEEEKCPGLSYLDNDASAWAIAARPLKTDWLVSLEPLKGYVKYLYFYNRALSADEIAWLHAEPYANIIQPQYWYMVDFGAAGGQVASLSDMFSLGENLSPIGHYGKTISDNLAFTESRSQIGHFKQSMSDTFSLSDTVSVSAVLTGALSDTISFTDNVGAALHAIAVLSDIFALTDNLTYPLGQTGSLSDSLTFSDSQSAKAYLLASVSDVFALSDTATALAALKATLSDTFGLSDEVTTKLVGNLSDTLLFSDNISALGSFVSSLSDAIVLTDGVTATAHFKVALSDNLTLSETLSGLAKYAAALVDSLAFSDIVTGINVTATGVVTITFSSKLPAITFSGKEPSITFS